MCDRGAPAAQRAMCACYSRRAVVAVALLALAGTAYLWAGLPLILLAVLSATGVIVGYTAWMNRQWGVSAAFRRPRAVQASPEPVRDAPQVQWWERARIGERP